jgi:hypothetical protein
VNYTAYKADSARLKYDTFLDYFACSETVECHRDHLRLEDNYVKILVLRDRPSHTAANLFKALLEIPSNFVMTSEWTREGNYSMRKKIQSARRQGHDYDLAGFGFEIDQRQNRMRAPHSDDTERYLRTHKIPFELETQECVENSDPLLGDPRRREQFEAVQRWFYNDWKRIEPKLRTSIVEGISVFLSLFDDNLR